MTKSTLLLILTLSISLLTLPTTAQAQSVLQVRCSVDSLDAIAALQRVEWARKCGLLTNTGGPNSFNVSKDYREIDPNHAYSSISNDYNVNYTYGFCRYQPTLLYTMFQESSGPTAGFWKWSATVQRPRPFYPIFETAPFVGGGLQLLPLPTLPNDCSLYQRDLATGGLLPWTGNFYVVGYCEAL
jgi:hypothetical protein